MLKEERQQLILNLLNQQGKLVATELSQTLHVSEDTIRRDLREMDAVGMIHRVHGGALPKSPPAVHYVDRQNLAVETKERLANQAAALVRNGQVILMDGGTTTLKLAERLPKSLMATVVTNSPPVAIALAGHPKVEVILIGGQLYKDSLVNIGTAAVETLNRIRADVCFLGIYSLHPEIGISVPYIEETYVKRQMISISSEVVALATSDKLGTSSSFIVAPTHSLTYLVTEKDISEEILAPYNQLGITVLQA
ncbi:DeoR/GlpR family DNA-binding transcription regulator [Cohnella nanjingensis]|uniref:Lactose phosphotransferase system repressor n=1 Tax=Cohnella nanjingensis TaxID=1387779 RepID=A0A7X0RNJ0_9BACL|nr:DeoR/GlpR family DNA-binding transcription regulator [Cohnella nanjingensis]MBB6670799.1 DeoR/GlpR transcriptional regulator [Cohnella nanjingensis]